MKNRFLLSIPTIISSLMLFSCSGAQKNADTDADSAPGAPEEKTAETVLPADSVIPFETLRFEKTVGENKLEMEFPVKGGDSLIYSIGNWINECLTSTYTGPLDDGETLFRHYASQLGTDPDLNEYGGYTIDEFNPMFESAQTITYDHTYYIYEGGAHGMGGSYGTSFLRSDGTVFTKNEITSYLHLKPLFISGLKRFFKVRTDQELMENLLTVKTLDDLPSPAIDPWIDKDGIVFSYTPYEIAAYSWGSPRFTIPFSEMEKFLTPEGKRFIPTPEE